MRALTGVLTTTWLCALAVLPAGTASAQSVTPTDTQLADFAFASELGSGIYSINGRTITVYTVPLGYSLRAAAPRGGRPGIKLLLPVTFGFFNFRTSDLAHFDLPNSIGALSLEPGIELDYWMNDAWHLYPYVKAGATWASSSSVDALIYGTGVRSDYRFDAWASAGLWRAELMYAGVHYHSNLPNDSFTRLRNGLELRRNLPSWSYRGYALQLGPYVVTDIYFNAPQGPASGISANTLQLETGVMLDVVPGWHVFGLPLPRLGIGYRFAGVLSGWRLVLGDPF